MLGRWDATNVVDAQVAVVTNIGIDHTEFAGPTLADIAREKAGIIKPGSAAVIGETDPDLVGDLRRRAGGVPPRPRRGLRHRRQPARRRRADRSTCARRRRSTPRCSCRSTAPTRATTRRSRSPRSRRSSPPRSPRTSSTRGSPTSTMPGRFEVMGMQPLSIVDGAHNPPGADTCAQVFFDDFHPDGRRILVVGTLRDPAEMLAALRADEFDVVHACTAPSPRGVPGGGRRQGGARARLRRGARRTTPSRRPAAGPCAAPTATTRCSPPAASTSPATPARPSASCSADPTTETTGAAVSPGGPAGDGWGAGSVAAMSDRTLVLLKPDAVERGLVGQILSRFEAKGLGSWPWTSARSTPTPRPALRGARRQGLLRRPGRVHEPGAGGGDGGRGAGGHLGGGAHDDGRHQPAQRGAGHDPRRPRDPVHREPRPRQRLARLSAEREIGIFFPNL